MNWQLKKCKKMAEKTFKNSLKRFEPWVEFHQKERVVNLVITTSEKSFCVYYCFLNLFFFDFVSKYVNATYTQEIVHLKSLL